MKPIAHKRFSILLTNEMYWSKAYQSLTLKARNLLWCMVAELKFTGKRGSKKHPFSYTNNGRIAFTEYEWKKQRLGASATYLNARNQLIRVGFISITYKGGFACGDMNRYRLLFIDGVNRKNLNLKGSELISIKKIEEGVNPSDKVTLEIKYISGEIKRIETLCRIDTKNELEYYKNGGILQYVLRNMI